MTDIFKEAKEQTIPTWAKFAEAGDSVQGTYIMKITGQKDGYDNEQVIYQLLQDDESVVNVGFGLNKKFIIQDMEQVNFGQIIGFKFKGKIQIPDKKRPGNTIEVKDFGLHQDPKIVDTKWLEANKDNMPQVTQATVDPAIAQSAIDANKEFNAAPTEGKDGNDVPFSSEGSLTEEDKLGVIEKLAKDKLGATNQDDAKIKVMEKFSLACIPLNYDQIIEQLKTIA